MAQPARKFDEADDEVAPAPKPKGNFQAIPGGGQSTDIAPSILRLVKDKAAAQQGPQAEDSYKSQTEDARKNLQQPKSPAEPGQFRPGATVPEGFQAPPPQRTSAEDKAFRLGKTLGQIKADPKQGTAQALSDYLNAGNKNQPGGKSQDAQKAVNAASKATQLDLNNLDVGKIADKAEHGDLRGAVGEAATELGVGKKIGDILFVIWGLMFFLSGAMPLLGLFNAIPFFLIFNLLLFSPKTVYRITEFILDAVGVGEILQAADKAGLGKTKITIRGFEKAGIIILDLGFVLWQLLALVIPLYFLCQVAGFGSNIPGLNTILNVAGAGAEVISGVPVSGLRETCQILGGAVSGFPGANSNAILLSPGAKQCQVVQGSGGASCSAGCDLGDRGRCGLHDAAIARAANLYNIEPNLIRAIITRESSWNDNVGCNGFNACGLMQMTPGAWDQARAINSSCGSFANATNPDLNIMCGTAYMKWSVDQLTRLYGTSVSSDIRNRVASHNAGVGTKSRSGTPGAGPFAQSRSCSGKFNWDCPFTSSAQTACVQGSLPVYADCGGSSGFCQTRNYVTTVLRVYQDYGSGTCNR
jgi:hypothetical protein